MKKTIEIVSCDICGSENECSKVVYPVMFHTEQNEGKSCKPYISNEKIDVCQECLSKIIKVHAIGTMGNNKYSIK